MIYKYLPMFSKRLCVCLYRFISMRMWETINYGTKERKRLKKHFKVLHQFLFNILESTYLSNSNSRCWQDGGSDLKSCL